MSHFKADLGGNSLSECFIGCSLDGGTISQGVGKGDAELDDVTSTAGKKRHYLQGCFNSRITYCDVGNESSMTSSGKN
jgi:hypothetical protein